MNQSWMNPGAGGAINPKSGVAAVGAPQAYTISGTQGVAGNVNLPGGGTLNPWQVGAFMGGTDADKAAFAKEVGVSQDQIQNAIYAAKPASPGQWAATGGPTGPWNQVPSLFNPATVAAGTQATPTTGGAPVAQAPPTAAPVQPATAWANAPAQPTQINDAAQNQMLAQAKKLTGLARGGIAAGPAVVGEKGKELIVPSGPTQVIPLKDDRSKQASQNLPHMQGGGTLYGTDYGSGYGGYYPTNADPAILALYGGYMNQPPTAPGARSSSTGQPAPARLTTGFSAPASSQLPPMQGKYNFGARPNYLSAAAGALSSAISAAGGILGGAGAATRAAAAAPVGPGYGPSASSALAQGEAATMNAAAAARQPDLAGPGWQAYNPLSGYGMATAPRSPATMMYGPGGPLQANTSAYVNATPPRISATPSGGGGAAPGSWGEAWANATPMQRQQMMRGIMPQAPQGQQQEVRPNPITPVPMGGGASGMGSYMGPYGYVPLQERTQQP
jgi:hypothetical protein